MKQFTLKHDDKGLINFADVLEELVLLAFVNEEINLYIDQKKEDGVPEDNLLQSYRTKISHQFQSSKEIIKKKSHSFISRQSQEGNQSIHVKKFEEFRHSQEIQEEAKDDSIYEELKVQDFELEKSLNNSRAELLEKDKDLKFSIAEPSLVVINEVGVDN